MTVPCSHAVHSARTVLVVVTAGCREEAKRKGAVGDSGWGLGDKPW